MSIETVNVYVTDDNQAADPVEGVVVRFFDASGTFFITSAVTDAAGLASASLVAPLTYQLRFFKEKLSIKQPQGISVLEAPVLPETNNFTAVGHVFKPPEAVNPRLCRCSGFFKRPDNSVARGHNIHVIAKFDPILFDGNAMLTERITGVTDDDGYIQFDLVRFGQYDVTIEGFEDRLRCITIPDYPSVNLPDLLFPVISLIEFDPVPPWSVVAGGADFPITPVVWSSDGRIIAGTAINDVRWSTSDPNVAVVLVTPEKLFLRGLAAGSVELRAERLDKSIIRIPDTPIEGVPAVFTVA